MAARKKNSLFIVESPTKATTIGKYLGKDFTVKATVGHVRDLPQRELGVDVDQGFRPKYITIRGKGKTLAELKKAARTATDIYLATDPDREGEAIAWHVTQHLFGEHAPTPADDGKVEKPKGKKAAAGKSAARKPAGKKAAAAARTGPRVHRVLLREITKDAVAAAIATPGEIDDRKVEAQQARRILDRLVGYKASPLLWKSVKTGLSAGRVQTVALRLIVERENEIRAFKPVEYWTIEAELEAQGKKFNAKLHKIDGRKPELPTADAANAVVAAVTGQPFVVSEVTRKERRKHPGAPFTTSTLQQEAAKQLGYSSRRTMRLAQDLYEGIEIGTEGAVGLITYMRTDSTRVAPAAIDAVRSFIKDYFEPPYLPAQPNVYTNKKASRVQDAHEAVRPSDVRRRPESVRKHLNPDQYKLYELIWKRFVASQMAPAVYDTTTIDFPVGRHLFRATGSVVIFDGYHAIYREGREAEEGKTLDDLAPVPPLKEGDRAEVHKVVPSQHFTEPPPRYSEASLVKELERLGIGRPSTYSSIIGTLRNREYVTVKDRRFTSTDLGETVAKVMISRFPDIFNVEFTSGMENELDKVEEGDLGWQKVLSDFWGPFSKALEGIDTDAMIREAHDVGDLSQEKCPEDGGELKVRSGRFGPFIACVNYPTCRYTRPLKRDKVPDRPTDQVCKVCGAPMVIKTGRYGEFLACTRYPECKHTRPIPIGVKCPKCTDGELAERRTKRGRSFYGCGNYPECDFSTWYRPVAETCPECKNVGVEKRATKGRGEYRRCLKCQTEYSVEEGAGAAVAT